jgi:protoheme IX farnesyltransferase
MNSRFNTQSVSGTESVLDHAATRTRLKEYWELTKPRLSLLSIITAIVGYLVANPSRNFTELFALIIGTAFAAGGAGTLNQWLEREVDARMVRTRNRPLPSGQIKPLHAFVYGMALSVSGCCVVTFGTNLLAGVLTVATLISYLCVYTPMKRISPWSIQVGAIPGALPPLIGWAAAMGDVSGLGWILFGVLFAWQIPHFMAIAWTYRKDYALGGMPMLPVIEPTGSKAARESIFYCVLLLVISVMPVFLGYTTWVYGSIAVLLGAYYLKRAIDFAVKEDREVTARKLFFASISYLPFLLAVLVIDRWLLI